MATVVKLVDTTQRRLAVLGRPYARTAKGDLIALASWARENLVRVDFPAPLALGWDLTRSVSRCVVHRLLEAQLRAAFADLKAKGLWKHFRSYCGSYAVRKVRGREAVSAHAFGAALDFNCDEMPLGSKRRWPAALVAVWNAHGFVCGQDFSRPDPMHFEARKVFTEVKGDGR